MKTICLNCGTILTNEKGERLESAHFDSFLPVKPSEQYITWARCGACYKVAWKRKEEN